MKTIIAGHVTHDRYAGGLVAGGCAYYGARVHAELADRAHLVGAVGADFSCEDAIADIDATLHRAGKTTVFANYYPPDGPRIQVLEALAGPVEPDMALSARAADRPRQINADLVHLAPVLGEVDLGAWTRAAGDGLVAINIQGWIKVAGPDIDTAALEDAQRRGAAGLGRRVVQRPWQVDAADFMGVDIACVSHEDLIDQPGLLDKLVAGVPIVAETLGAKGSRIYVGGDTIRVGAFGTDTVDPTGAGDVFAAAFCHRIAAGYAPANAARFGAACASVVVEDRGARALHRLDQAPGRMASISASIDR